MYSTGIVFGSFDIMHPGYALMFKEAKKHCQYLIVGLHVDPSIERPNKNKPVQTIWERFMVIGGNRFVDEIIPYETEEDVLVMLSHINPEVRFLDESYKDKDFTGKSIKHIPITYLKRKHNYSSSALRKRIKDSK